MTFKQRLAGSLIGLAVCLVAIPVAVFTTFALTPFWSWLEATFEIESLGHSGPAEWCYLFVYLLVVCVAGVAWTVLGRKRTRGM